MARAIPLRFQAIILLPLILALAIFTSSRWLPLMAAPLVHNDGPAKADLAVVLAGDTRGFRLHTAATLVRDGFVPRVLVSGPGYYGQHECDAAIAFAVKEGFPQEWFIPLPNSSNSTREEAEAILADLRRRRTGSFLLVTSDFHTARANRVFQKLERTMGGPSYRVVAAPTEGFSPGSWWRSRGGWIVCFLEWSKTLVYAAGI